MEIIRILTDRGTAYRDKLETHDCQLYLGVNDIEHAGIRARHPQSNGIREVSARPFRLNFARLRSGANYTTL